MKFHFFASTMGLPWSNPWRKMYRQSRKIGCKDPLIQNIFRVMAILCGIGFLCVILGPITGVISKSWGPNLSSSEFLSLLLVGFMILFVGCMFCSDLGWREMEFKEATEKMRELLGFIQKELWRVSRGKLRNAACMVLLSRGTRLRKAELATGDPLDEERVKAKKMFEDAYHFLTHVGLIDDVGYGRFIQTSEERKPSWFS